MIIRTALLTSLWEAILPPLHSCVPLVPAHMLRWVLSRTLRSFFVISFPSQDDPQRRLWLGGHLCSALRRRRRHRQRRLPAGQRLPKLPAGAGEAGRMQCMRREKGGKRGACHALRGMMIPRCCGFRFIVGLVSVGAALLCARACVGGSCTPGGRPGDLPAMVPRGSRHQTNHSPPFPCCTCLCASPPPSLSPSSHPSPPTPHPPFFMKDDLAFL